MFSEPSKKKILLEGTSSRDSSGDLSSQMTATLDRISNLPEELISGIFNMMPMRDAVRTSLLSTTWRYKWVSMPELVFSHNSILPSEDRRKSDSNLVNIVTNVLLLHNSVISKFELRNFLERGCSDVDRWIFVLSKKNVNHLVLRFKNLDAYQLPGCLFSCQSLRILELKCCRLKLPPRYQGLGCLTRLELSYVNLTKETFESLLAKLPILKWLKVFYCESLTHFNLYAPNLVLFVVHGICHTINLHNSPRLKAIGLRIGLPGNIPSCKLPEILRNWNGISVMCIAQPVMEFSSIDAAPRRLDVTYPNLKHIQVDVNFEDSRQILAILCLCRSSPCLQELTITAETGGQSVYCDFFGERQLLKEEDIFCHLKTVRLLGFKGVGHAEGFVQFILLNAIVLKTLRIQWAQSNLVDKELLHLLERMIRFKRASYEADVMFSGL